MDADKIVVRSGGEVVTPLTDMPYSEQLKRKMNDATVLVNALLRQMAPAGVENARKISATDILQPVGSITLLEVDIFRRRNSREWSFSVFV